MLKTIQQYLSDVLANLHPYEEGKSMHNWGYILFVFGMIAVLAGVLAELW